MIVKDENKLENEPELLKLMLQDLEKAPKLYRPSAYWANYEKKFVSELKKLGLKDFRRRKNSVFQSFSTYDLDPIDRYLRKLYRDPLEGIFPPSKSALFKRFIRFGIQRKSFKKMIKQISRLYFGITLEQKLFSMYEFAKYYGIANEAKPISNLSDSLIGSPKNTLKIENNVYTFTLLRYYLLYAQTCKTIDYDSIESVMEIGAGGCGQVEVLKKLYPHLTFFLFDIPPQLYVGEQYLKSIFPNDVISYRETRNMNEAPINIKGKIFIFAPWHLEKIKNLSYDLFWNSSSFQEMTSEIVLNYLKFVNKQTKKFVFLHNEMNPISGTKINFDVGKKTYIEGLKQFELIKYEPSAGQFLDSHTNIVSTIWKNH